MKIALTPFLMGPNYFKIFRCVLKKISMVDNFPKQKILIWVQLRRIYWDVLLFSALTEVDFLPPNILIIKTIIFRSPSTRTIKYVVHIILFHEMSY